MKKLIVKGHLTENEWINHLPSKRIKTFSGVKNRIIRAEKIPVDRYSGAAYP